MKQPLSAFTAGIVSPAGCVAEELFPPAVAALESYGIKVKLFSTPGINPRAPHKYLAADDEQRAAELTEAWMDSEVSLIICARGGYGSARVLPLLDWELLRTREMTVAGFSDITALHWAMMRQNAGEVLSAPMLNFFGRGLDDLSRETFFNSLQKKEVTIELPSFNGGKVSAHPLAGNLTVAASLAGTAYFPDTAGKIIILEDVGEHPYRIDRMLMQLLLAGTFERCAALVFGNFTGCGNADELHNLFAEFAGRVNCPVFYGLPFGHELPFHSISSDAVWNISSI